MMEIDLTADAETIHRGMVLLFLDMAATVDPSRPGTDAEDTPANYRLRNAYVYQALGFATAAGMTCGIDIDPMVTDWPLVFIDLPTGQVSWHMPGYRGTYDDHTTAEKYARITAYGAQLDTDLSRG